MGSTMAHAVSRLFLTRECQVSIPVQSGGTLAGKVAVKSLCVCVCVYGKASVQNGSGAHPTSYSISNEGSFPWLKASVKLTIHLPAFGVGVKNKWSYVSASPMCLQLYQSWVVKCYSDALQDSLRTPVLLFR